MWIFTTLAHPPSVIQYQMLKILRVPTDSLNPFPGTVHPIGLVHLCSVSTLNRAQDQLSIPCSEPIGRDRPISLVAHNWFVSLFSRIVPEHKTSGE